MAEGSSTLKPNTSSDDFIVKSIQEEENIDSQVGLIPQVRQGNQDFHEIALFRSVDQDDTHATNLSNLSQNDGTQVTNFSNLSQFDDTQVTNFSNLSQNEDTQITNFSNLLQNDETQVTSFSNLSQFDDTHVTNVSTSSKTDVINEGKQEQNGGSKKEKRPRKRGKGMKKNVINDFERQSVCDCDIRGDRARVAYVREELEGLRYAGVEEQRKKWIGVYCGLGSAVCKEYDNIVGTKHDEEDNLVNFDPRTRFANKKAGATASGCMGNKPDNIGSEMQNSNDLDAEEDYYEDEDSDSDYVSIQRPAFYVTGEPDFDAGPPQDGLEYLRRVRWEVEHIPKVTVAKAKTLKEQTVYMPEIPDIAPCPEHLMPLKEWEDVFLADFSKLRMILSQDENSASTFSSQIESLPLAQTIIENTIQENLDFCQTDDVSSFIHENPNLNQTEDMTTICDWPSLQAILEMEPVARVTMLRKRITSMETKSFLCRADCAWLFALCAAIDIPLNADTSASLRCLLRKCATLRSEKTSLDDEVIMLNILVTISGKYFGQLETK
ncbi:uncharacterized protein [Rutidosis leptorrhynchoides]|uniref:uncharacterized protein n=1 Tax=Rutidosis leptorrhynchoides TaxID=125765 RepID=UPI003A9904F2